MLLVLSGVAFLVVLTWQMRAPSPNIYGFLTGMVASQLHLPIIYFHAAIMWYLTSLDLVLPNTPFGSILFVICVSCYALFIHDFVIGFAINIPQPIFGGRSHVARYSGSQLTVAFGRMLIMIFPWLILPYWMLSNVKHKYIQYNDSQSHIDVHLDIVTSSSRISNSSQKVCFVT